MREGEAARSSHDAAHRAGGGAERDDRSRPSAAGEKRIRVCIVDDDPFVTTSLATILAAEPDVAVEGEGHDGQEAVALFERERPDVLLMDIQMPGVGGLDAAERILAAHPEARIVFLTTFSDDEYIVRALRLGAKGYLIKQEVGTIAPALRSVAAGQSVLGGEVLGRVDALVRGRVPSDAARLASAGGAAAGPPAAASAGQARAAALLGRLSERERAIVEQVAEGLDNKEIAAALYISEGTVRNHISAILQKLQLKNRTQLAIAYYRSAFENSSSASS